MNNYFPHDSNARNSDKLIPLRARFGAEGYGIYFMLIERLREEPSYMSIKDYNMLAFDFRVDAGKVKSVIEDFGLFAFTEDGKCFYSESLMRRMKIKDEKSEKAKRAARSRWNKNIADASECECECIADASENDASKVKKSKVNNKKPTDVGKKGFDPPPPSTKKSFEFKSLKAQTEELCSDSSWLSVVSEATGLDSEEIAGLVRGKFLKHCVAEGKDHDGQTSDAKSHFVRWFRRQNEEKKNPNEASGARKAGLTKAEARAIEDLERLKRNETWEKEKLNRQSPADYIRSLGYDPEKVSLKQVMQPEWRRKNPPKPI